MDYRIHQHLVRTIIALCALAATTDEDARAELADESVEALQAGGTVNGAETLRVWCTTANALIERLRTSGANEHACTRASVALLRLRTALPLAVSPKDPIVSVPAHSSRRTVIATDPDVITKNQQRILDALQQVGPSRTRDLVAHVAGTLSDRTVKRSLKELVAAELVCRNEKDGAIVYARVDTKVVSAI